MMKYLFKIIILSFIKINSLVNFNHESQQFLPMFQLSSFEKLMWFTKRLSSLLIRKTIIQ